MKTSKPGQKRDEINEKNERKKRKRKSSKVKTGEEKKKKQEVAVIPCVSAAGLQQVIHFVIFGVSGDESGCFGGEVVGGDALQTRDLEGETHRAQTGRSQTLQHAETTLKMRRSGMEIILK